MAQTFCIPPALADRLKKAAQDGEINIADMYEMNSEARRNFFTKWVDDETAKQINLGFEKAMISNQKNALKKWAEYTFSGNAKKERRYKDILDKIEDLEDLGVLQPEKSDAFLEDLVAEKLGLTITEDQAKIIHDKANKLQSLGEARNDFGLPTEEYFIAKRDLDNYLDSLNPTSEIKLLSSTIGRGAMLASVKSPILNITTNTLQGLLQAGERRIMSRGVRGLNGDFGNKYIQYVNKVYQKSGYDVTRMYSLQSDKKTLGEEILHSQGEGKIRKVARFYEDIVFKQLMGAPDVAFSSIAFADSANLQTSLLAKTEGLKGDKAKARALEIYKDATRIDPQTDLGKKVRAQAIADAEVATFTQKGKWSDFALSVRGVINEATGSLRLGDQIMPFVKTSANAQGGGIESSGVLLPIDALIKAGNTVSAMKKGESWIVASKENFQGMIRPAIRAGIGLSLAYAIVSAFDPEDFIGEFPLSEKERKLLELKNATPNSVKIGDKWVSLDYFGVLAAPIIGMFYARKYGDTLPEKIVKFYEGVGYQSLKIPGVSESYETVKEIRDRRPDKEPNVQDDLKNASTFAADFIRSRIVPAIFYDVGKATDTAQRQSEDPIDSFTQANPLARQELKEKRNVFGETRTTEGFKTLLFGERVKQVKSDNVTNELNRLAETGNLPSITDVAKTSERAQRLKKQIGDEKFEEAMQSFGKTFKERLNVLMESEIYKDMPDDKKKDKIDGLKQKVFKLMLLEYGYDPTAE